MAKTYLKPYMEEYTVALQPLFTVTSSETDHESVYTDDPQNPGDALARRHRTVWDGDDELDNEEEF